MATGDILSICRRALLAIGARTQISSVSPSDGSVEADACSTLFQPTFETLARTAKWNCLGRQATLSLYAAAQGTPENPDGTVFPTPPTPWLYAYAYPSDCLDLRYIVPSYPANQGGSTPPTTINNGAGAWVPNQGQIPYQVQTVVDVNETSIVVILTNQDQAQAVYTVNQPDPVSWDSLFQQAMVSSLGAYLVPALSLALPLLDRCIKQAEQAIAVARAMDGNEGVTSQDHIPDWYQARAGAGGSWAYGGVTGWGGYMYSGICWPSYSGYGD